MQYKISPVNKKMLLIGTVEFETVNIDKVIIVKVPAGYSKKDIDRFESVISRALMGRNWILVPDTIEFCKLTTQTKNKNEDNVCGEKEIEKVWKNYFKDVK